MCELASSINNVRLRALERCPVFPPIFGRTTTGKTDRNGHRGIVFVYCPKYFNNPIARAVCGRTLLSPVTLSGSIETVKRFTFLLLLVMAVDQRPTRIL